MEKIAGYVIRANEPDGGKKAYEVLKDGAHISWFRWRDDAEYFVSQRMV